VDTTRPNDLLDELFADLIDDIFARIADSIVVEPDGCWTVPGTSYPSIRIGAFTIKLHRFMYALCVGPIPQGFEVDHECHNRAGWCNDADACVHRRCIRPDHLAARTHQDNMRAAWRGRRRPPKRPLRRGAWIATADLAVDLGLVAVDADDATIQNAAILLGRAIVGAAPDVRPTEARPARDGRRRRGFYVDDLPAGMVPRAEVSA
jgi:hypothetical protein